MSSDINPAIGKGKPMASMKCMGCSGTGKSKSGAKCAKCNGTGKMVTKK